MSANDYFRLLVEKAGKCALASIDTLNLKRNVKN